MMPKNNTWMAIACEIPHCSGQREILVKRANIMSKENIHIVQNLVKVRGECIDQFSKFRWNAPRVQFGLDRKNIWVARVSHWKMNERDARISLLSSSRHNLNLMTSIYHQAGMLPQHAFHPADDWWCGVVK